MHNNNDLFLEGYFPWEDVYACRDNGEASEKNEIKNRLRNIIQPCPSCQKTIEDLEVLYFESPPETWRMMCGRAGWMVACFHCKKQIWFELCIMN